MPTFVATNGVIASEMRQVASASAPAGVAAAGTDSRGLAASAAMLYCYIMSHHHHGEVPHPSPVLSPSLLRYSAVQRLGLAVALIALVWAFTLWAMH